MTITSPLHSFFRTLNRNRSRVPSHPEALQERYLTLPRRIDDPASAASSAGCQTPRHKRPLSESGRAASGDVVVVGPGDCRSPSIFYGAQRLELWEDGG